jgi:hypothetical protein
MDETDRSAIREVARNAIRRAQETVAAIATVRADSTGDDRERASVLMEARIEAEHAAAVGAIALSERADDGTRTHDLLHGKQTL